MSRVGGIIVESSIRQLLKGQRITMKQHTNTRIERYKCRTCKRWLESPTDVEGQAIAFCRHCKSRTMITIGALPQAQA
jgi:DNA-directed RNA polymerase subunit RPC12/RpoP